MNWLGGGTSVEPNATWETLVLSDKTLRTLKMVCEKLHRFQDLRTQNMEMPAGVLLYGPPGTGKTRIAETLANESKLGLVPVTLADTRGRYVGESSRLVSRLFARARKEAPCILFFDELDEATSQTESEDAFITDFITTMKMELAGLGSKDSPPVFLLAAANNKDSIDSAILWRFTDRILIPNPDQSQRAQILKILLAKQKKDFEVDPVCAELSALLGDSTSGRDLKILVQHASNLAFERAIDANQTSNVVLSREDLLSALTPED